MAVLSAKGRQKPRFGLQLKLALQSRMAPTWGAVGKSESGAAAQTQIAPTANLIWDSGSPMFVIKKIAGVVEHDAEHFL